MEASVERRLSTRAGRLGRVRPAVPASNRTIDRHPADLRRGEPERRSCRRLPVRVPVRRGSRVHLPAGDCRKRPGDECPASSYRWVREPRQRFVLIASGPSETHERSSYPERDIAVAHREYCTLLMSDERTNPQVAPRLDREKHTESGRSLKGRHRAHPRLRLSSMKTSSKMLGMVVGFERRRIRLLHEGREPPAACRPEQTAAACSGHVRPPPAYRSYYWPCRFPFRLSVDRRRPVRRATCSSVQLLP